jgi:hypothetical protein
LKRKSNPQKYWGNTKWATRLSILLIVAEIIIVIISKGFWFTLFIIGFAALSGTIIAKLLFRFSRWFESK